MASAVLEAIGGPDWLSKSKTAALNLVKSGFDLNRMVGEYISLHEKLSSDTK